MKSKTIKFSDIANHPTNRMDAKYWVGSGYSISKQDWSDDTKKIIESISEIRYDRLPPMEERTMSQRAYEKILIDATKYAIKTLYAYHNYDLEKLQKATREAGGNYHEAFVDLYGENLKYAKGGLTNDEVLAKGKTLRSNPSSLGENTFNNVVTLDDNTYLIEVTKRGNQEMPTRPSERATKYEKGGSMASGGLGLKTYEIKGVDVTYSEDSYEEGELGHFHSYMLNQSEFPYQTKFHSKKELLDTLNEFISYADFKEDDFFVDENTIQVSAIVKYEKGSDWDEFSAPTKEEIELWKQGKMKLYSAQFVFPYEVYRKEKLDFAKGGAIKGRNNKTSESFGVVIGSMKYTDEDKDRVQVDVRSGYSSRISERKLVFDRKGNLIETTYYGYTLDGTLPKKDSGQGRSINASNKKETIDALVDLGYNKGFANKLIDAVKDEEFDKGGDIKYNDVLSEILAEKGYELIDIYLGNKLSFKERGNIRQEANTKFKEIHKRQSKSKGFNKWNYAKGGEIDGQTFRSAVIWAEGDIHENFNYEETDLDIQTNLLSDHTELYKASNTFGIRDYDTWREIYEIAFEDMGIENPPQFAKGGKLSNMTDKELNVAIRQAKKDNDNSSFAELSGAKSKNVTLAKLRSLQEEKSRRQKRLNEADAIRHRRELKLNSPNRYAKGGKMKSWKFKPSDEGWLEGVGYIKILQLLPIDEAYHKERYFYRKMDNGKVAWSYKDKFEKSDDFAFTLREDLDEDYLKSMGYAKGGKTFDEVWGKFKTDTARSFGNPPRTDLTCYYIKHNTETNNPMFKILANGNKVPSEQELQSLIDDGLVIQKDCSVYADKQHKIETEFLDMCARKNNFGIKLVGYEIDGKNPMQFDDLLPYHQSEFEYAKGGEVITDYEYFRAKDHDDFFNYIMDRISLEERRAIRNDWNEQERRSREKGERGTEWQQYLLDSVNKMAKGGMTQGYNDRMDESLGMRHRGHHSQSHKDRRDEAKGMNKSIGNQAYQSVGSMDKMANGGHIREVSQFDDKDGVQISKVETTDGKMLYSAVINLKPFTKLIPAVSDDKEQVLKRAKKIHSQMVTTKRDIPFGFMAKGGGVNSGTYFFNWNEGGFNEVYAKTKSEAIKKATEEGYPSYMPDNEYALKTSLQDVKDKYGKKAVDYIIKKYSTEGIWSNKDQKTYYPKLTLKSKGFSSGLTPNTSSFRKQTIDDMRRTNEMANRMTMANGGGVGDNVTYSATFDLKDKKGKNIDNPMPSIQFDVSSDVTYSDAKNQAKIIFESGTHFEKGMQSEMTDFWMGEIDADEEDRKRVEIVEEEEQEEFVPRVERSGKWDSSYSVLCDELSSYESGGEIITDYEHFRYKDHSDFTDYVMDRISLEERRAIRNDWNEQERRSREKGERGTDWKQYLLDRVNEKKSFGGGIALGSIVGGYVGFKIGRAMKQKKGFDTEKRVAKKTINAIGKGAESLAKGSAKKGKAVKKMEDGGIVDKYEYISLIKNPNSLRVELTDNGIEAYNDEEVVEMYDLFENISNNSQWAYVDDAGQVGFGLTSAPIITDGFYIDDDGEFTDDGNSDSKVYVWNDYMVKDLFETLMEQGSVELSEVKSDNEYADGGSLDSAYQDLDWRDTTEAYYGLDFTPFMNVIEEHYDLDSMDLDSAYQDLGWRDTTEAYYELDFTPFMNVIEEIVEKGNST
jgi:hypothetical protein